MFYGMMGLSGAKHSKWSTYTSLFASKCQSIDRRGTKRHGEFSLVAGW